MVKLRPRGGIYVAGACDAASVTLPARLKVGRDGVAKGIINLGAALVVALEEHAVPPPDGGDGGIRAELLDVQRRLRNAPISAKVAWAVHEAALRHAGRWVRTPSIVLHPAVSRL